MNFRNMCILIYIAEKYNSLYTKFKICTNNKFCRATNMGGKTIIKERK